LLLPLCITRSQLWQKGRRAMIRFVIGALAGGLAVWFWGNDLREYADSKTRDVRGKAAQKLQAVENKAADVLDMAKEQVTSTLHAGQNAIRPSVRRRRIRRFARVGQAALAVALALCASAGCATHDPVLQLPALQAADPAFSATLAAYSGSTVVSGNRVDILLNGDEIFPAKLRAI